MELTELLKRIAEAAKGELKNTEFIVGTQDYQITLELAVFDNKKEVSKIKIPIKRKNHEKLTFFNGGRK